MSGLKNSPIFFHNVDPGIGADPRATEAVSYLTSTHETETGGAPYPESESVDHIRQLECTC
jgi:hypothetical protein